MSNACITTAISYTNGPPHIGHLYETILADFLKHLKIVSGISTKLVTGTDEHGKKIEDTAQNLHITPKELCNKYSETFRSLNDRVRTAYDYFIRTTDADHIQHVQECLKNVAPGDIYLHHYKGWYNVREESFVTELECKKTDYKDPVTGKAYEYIEEESYYFRLSKYQEVLQEYVRTLCIPEIIQKELSTKITELKDLSISRTSFTWGILFPYDEKHIVYVWFDALLNYVTAHRNLFGDKHSDIIHVIGKDIVWFHAVIYPAILYSLGYTQYITSNIFIHGFVTDKDGVKMSKSLGNVVEVDYILNKYNLEAIRYYFITNASIEDLRFSEENIVSQYNNELVKNFGNLFQRVFKLLIPHQDEINERLRNSIDVIREKHSLCASELQIEKNNVKKYVKTVQEKLALLNKQIQDEKPWDLAGEERISLLTSIYIDLYIILLQMYPIIPTKVDELRSYLGLGPVTVETIHNYNIEFHITATTIKAFPIIR